MNRDANTIEVDSDGKVYRVWKGFNFLGTFYRSPVDGKWLTFPVYDRDYERYATSDEAQEAIVDAWKVAKVLRANQLLTIN